MRVKLSSAEKIPQSESVIANSVSLMSGAVRSKPNPKTKDHKIIATKDSLN